MSALCTLAAEPDNWQPYPLHAQRGPIGGSVGSSLIPPPIGLTCASKDAGPHPWGRSAHRTGTPRHPSGLSHLPTCSKRSSLRVNWAIFCNFQRGGLQFGTPPATAPAPTAKPSYARASRPPPRGKRGCLSQAPPTRPCHARPDVGAYRASTATRRGSRQRSPRAPRRQH